MAFAIVETYSVTLTRPHFAPQPGLVDTPACTPESLKTNFGAMTEYGDNAGELGISWKEAQMCMHSSIQKIPERTTEQHDV